MPITRIFKHLLYPGWRLHQKFSENGLDIIEATIQSSEKNHSGEIRFAIESSLPVKSLFLNETSRERAIDVFSKLRVWDTEDNNGVLIYLLLADHKVEIIADRNITKVVDQAEWNRICQQMETQYKANHFSQGVTTGIEEVGKLLNQHFPTSENDINELSNKPVIL